MSLLLLNYSKVMSEKSLIPCVHECFPALCSLIYLRVSKKTLNLYSDLPKLGDLNQLQIYWASLYVNGSGPEITFLYLMFKWMFAVARETSNTASMTFDIILNQYSQIYQLNVIKMPNSSYLDIIDIIYIYCIGFIKLYYKSMSTNNQSHTNYGEWSSQNNNQYSSYQQPNKYSTQNNQMYLNTHQTVRNDNFDHRYPPSSKLNQFDYRDKNKLSQNYTLSSSHNTESMPSLSSYARKVDEAVIPNTTTAPYKFNDFNNSDGFNNNLNKFSSQSSRDFRLASSAIFPSSNPQEQDFNRFPAFNLNINPSHNLNQHANHKNPSEQHSQPHLNQTAKQKRQREIAQIKKQVQAINKKMVNKPQLISSFGQSLKPPTESRPLRNPGISQSVIFESNSNQGGFNQFNHSGGFNQMKPPIGNSPFSIDELYAQKKYQKPIKTNQEGKSSPFSQLTSASLNTVKNSSQQNTGYGYQVSSNNPKTNYQSYQPQQTITKSNYTNYNQFNQDKLGQKNQMPSFLSQKPKQQYGYNFQQTNKPVTAQSNSYLNKASQTTGFKKKKAYQQPIAISPTKPQFSKLREPQTASSSASSTFNPAMVQTKYPNTATSTGHKPQFKIKKSQSFTYQDSSIPLPEVKHFKLSDFSIGKKMGKGQFGEVLLVKHKQTGWLCGLKVMEKKQIRDQDYVGQIARQLSIQFYLQHRYVAQLYGYFEDQKNFYLLVQFCTGGQLLEKLRKQKRMNEKDVSVIVRQICQGVDYIHKQLIIHRDLKPENILFNFGNVKISDFGWAVYRGFGMRKTASGSPLYYPPQIVKGEEYDDKIDVWNIGMMTYECLLGKIPFRVYSQLDLGKIVSDQISFPDYVDVSDEAKDFILKTMKKKGQQRIEIREMLRHPFIKKYLDIEFSSAILDQFRKVLS